MKPSVLVWCSLGALALSFACSAADGDSPGGGSGGGASTGGQKGGDGDVTIDPGNLGCQSADCQETDTVCGNGVLGKLEVCDDNNEKDGDGCAADCAAIEPGFICPTPGKECRAFVRCGDGLVDFPEQCDDSNVQDGDGCSARCKLEQTYKCTGEPSSCTHTICGDNKIEGTEGCDDGDTIPFDGCSDTCQVEPTCGVDGCTSACGDGVVLDEACDDGNLIDGDGCSSNCTIEEGATCQSAPCETVGDACVVRVPVIYRDFLEGHSDFQPGCDGSVETTGIVKSLLASDGTPELSDSPPGNICISNFGDWYHDKSVNARIVSQLILFENGSGGYVNRYKDDGTKFVSLLGNEKDGQPFFFPIDNHPINWTPTGQYGTATVTKEYSDSDNLYEPESMWVASAPKHNFHFTSEVHYWFRYNDTEVASLEFVGDDDVWVFVNGKLAVDLGGLHGPRPGSVTISSATASNYGLSDGKVYPIHIFHAERKKDGSSFKLTLSGLSMGRSECGSFCGDGIIGPDEECDDGENLGGYNKCQPDCRLLGYCGDGVVQEEEACDFRAPDASPECTTACRIQAVR